MAKGVHKSGEPINCYTSEDSAFSTPVSLGIGAGSVVSACRTFETTKDSVISALDTHGTGSSEMTRTMIQ